MSKRPFLTAIILVTLAAGSASGQRGGGSVGGAVGGVVGGVGGAVGGAIGGVGRTVSGLGGPVGGLGGRVSGLGGSVGGGLTTFGNSLNNNSLGRFGTLAIREELANAVNPAMILENLYRPDIADTDSRLLLEIRRVRHEILIRSYSQVLDRDSAWQPVRKSELLLVDPDAPSLSAAIRAGFRIIEDEWQRELGIRIVTLACPTGVNVRQGLKQLRKAAPGIQADYNYVFEPAGGALLPAAGMNLASRSALRPGTRIAMIDGGVAAHPSFARASVEQRGFAGPAQPTAHGTAVGSLLVGNHGPFNGAARGAQLFVGDVYGGNPSAGSTTAIVRALAWAASKKPAVINISLVGPDNRSLAKAIASLRARGIQVIAAVGNDGPAAPPQYPASYPGVIAVTAVDGQDRALPEAGRSAHLDFAAPGADLVAALPGNGYAQVRGTSFAAPFVAARLAATGSTASLIAEAVPGKGKVGRGIVCRTCRTPPKMVGLR